MTFCFAVTVVGHRKMQTNNVYFLSILRKGNQHKRQDLFVSDGSNLGIHRHDFQSPCTAKCLTNRNSCMETPHVRWNLFVSDGTPAIGVLFTDGPPVFQWKANHIRWSLVDSIGQPSYSYSRDPNLAPGLFTQGFCRVTFQVSA